MKKLSVLGGGSFGTAIASVLANNGYKVFLWCYEIEVVDQINNLSENSTYLPGFRLSNNIIATDNLEQCLKDSKWIFEAVPVKFLRNVLNQAKPFITKEQVIIALSKGIEQKTLLLPTQIIEDVLKNNQAAIMAGPNFAAELMQHYYSVTMVACKKEKIAEEISKLLTNSYFKVELSNDIIGVQIGGAIKNLIAILVGIAQGYKVGKNTIAYLITKGLKEAISLSKFLGGKEKTVYGLAGLGDLILTSTGSLSRNLKIGCDIGKLKFDDKWDYKTFFDRGMLPEGINTIQSIHQLIKNNSLDLPLCNGTYKLLFNKMSFDKFLNSIL